jgi:hypothetical protein
LVRELECDALCAGCDFTVELLERPVQQVARMSEAKSGRSRPNALRLWLVAGTPSGVTSCRRLSAATDRPVWKTEPGCRFAHPGYICFVRFEG